MIADIPTGFDQWQWTQMPVANNTGAKAYFLQNPKIPSSVKRAFGESEKNANKWTCLKK